MRYMVTMDTVDQAKFLADRRGNGLYLSADGAVVTFDEAAYIWFAERPDTDDGHLDADGTLWFGGAPYPVTTQTIEVTRTDEQGTETIALTRDVDEIREVYTVDGTVLDDSITHAGDDTDAWLHSRLIDLRADGYR